MFWLFQRNRRPLLCRLCLSLNLFDQNYFPLSILIRYAQFTSNSISIVFLLRSHFWSRTISHTSPAEIVSNALCSNRFLALLTKQRKTIQLLLECAANIRRPHIRAKRRASALSSEGTTALLDFPAPHNLQSLVMSLSCHGIPTVSHAFPSRLFFLQKCCHFRTETFPYLSDCFSFFENWCSLQFDVFYCDLRGDSHLPPCNKLF